jgi:hypothetical protein
MPAGLPAGIGFRRPSADNTSASGRSLVSLRLGERTSSSASASTQSSIQASAALYQMGGGSRVPCPVVPKRSAAARQSATALARTGSGASRYAAHRHSRHRAWTRAAELRGADVQASEDARQNARCKMADRGQPAAGTSGTGFVYQEGYKTGGRFSDLSACSARL